MSRPMDLFKDNVASNLFGTTRTAAQVARICVTCKGEAKVFKDALSVEEYRISGLCQKCQDRVFGP